MKRRLFRVLGIVTALSILAGMLTVNPTMALSVDPQITPKAGAQDVPIDVTFSWSAIEGAASYDFEIDTEPQFINSFSINVLLNSYQMEDALEYNTIYWWRVTWCNADGTKGSLLEGVFKTELGPSSTLSPALTIEDGFSEKIRPTQYDVNVSVITVFNWPIVDGAVGYDLEIAEERGDIDKFIIIDLITDTSSNSYKLAIPLKYNTRYWWRIRPYDADGNEGSWIISTFLTEKESSIPTIIIFVVIMIIIASAIVVVAILITRSRRKA